MVKEVVGIVTEEEKIEIENYYSKQAALKELCFAFNNSFVEGNVKDTLYEKIVTDMQITMKLHVKWWADMSAKYKWRGDENGRWTINFQTNEIYLVKGDTTDEICS